MVDWNKDVKLSDLIARKQEQAAETTAPAPEQPDAHGQRAAESSVPAEPTASASVPFSPAPPAPPAPTQEVPMPEAELDLEPEPEAPTAERVPWYKRDISLGGGKGDKPRAKKTKQPKEKQPKEKQPKGERV